jgi:hypothetical protein
MDWNGFWSSVLSNAVWWLLFIGGSAVLGWLRAKRPQIAAPILYGLAGATCLGILWFTFTGHAFLSKSQPETTQENVEENVKKWVDELGLGITKNPKMGDVYFSYVVALKSGNPIAVTRVTGLPGFLQFQSQLLLAPEQQGELAKMSKEQVESVTQELILQLALSKVGYTLAGSEQTHLMQNIILMKSVPITGNLTEASFASSLDELDSALSLVRVTLALSIKRNRQTQGKAITPHVAQQ